MSAPTAASPDTPGTRVLVCEDDPRFARQLVRRLEQIEGIDLVGLATSGEEACQLCHALQPQLLLLDLELPDICGLQVIERLTPALAGLEILVLTSFSDEARVFAAIQAGAAGYLVKGIAPAKLADAIQEVIAGGTVIEPRLARRFWSYFASERGQASQSFGLSSEELLVLTLVARGLSNPEAARSLGATRRSVKAHLEQIYLKLGVNGRVEAAVKALRAGLIEL